MAAKLPEKKMPSTQANATSRSAKVDSVLEIQRSAQSALFLMHGTARMSTHSEERKTYSFRSR